MSKGRDFELEIYSAVKEQYKGMGDVRVFHGKGYYSARREKEIIFDVSVEFFRPGAKNYWFVILFECKCYAKKVPVDDVEEFSSKLDQVGKHNSKGFVVSSSGFQEGALSYSKNTGIGLAKYNGLSSISWILERSLINRILSKRGGGLSFVEKSLVSGSLDGNFSIFYIYYDGRGYSDFKGFSDSVIFGRTLPLARKRLKYLSVDDIQSQTESILDEAGYNDGVVDLQQVSGGFLEGMGYTVEYEAYSDLLYGKIDVERKIISINKNSSDEIARFTLAHEIAHCVLGHVDFMASERLREDSLKGSCTSGFYNPPIIKRMEWQANSFAACLLMPKKCVLHDFYCFIDKSGIPLRGRPFLFVDDQRCNAESMHKVLSELSGVFCVSRSAIKYRLKGLGLIRESYAAKSAVEISGSVF